jgi:hypothetical protein
LQLPAEELSKYLQSVFISARLHLTSTRTTELLYGLLTQGNFESIDKFLFTARPNLRKVVQTAVVNNLIDDITDEDIDAITEEIKLKIRTYLLDSDSGSEIALVFDTIGVTDSDTKNLILDTILQYSENDHLYRDKYDLIADLESKMNNTAPSVVAMLGKLEFLLHMAAVSDNIMLGIHLITLENNPVTTISGLIAYPDEDLTSIAATCLPPGFTTADEFVAFIRRNIETHFNEKVLVDNIRKDNAFPLSSVNEMFGAFPDFDFTQNLIEEQLNGESQLVDTLSEINLQTLNQEMKSLQRIYNLVPKQDNYPVICKLLQNGMTSAADKIRIGVCR